MAIGKIVLPVLTTVGGLFGLHLWLTMEDGTDRAATALLAGFLLARGISQLIYTWNTRHDTDNTGR
jgi:hypothetical protein